MSTQADCPGARRTTHSLSLLVRALLAASSFCLAGCAGLVKSSSTSPPPTLTISNPGSTNVTTTGAAVDWQTNVPATSQVEYGTTTYYGSTTAVDSTMVTIHQQSLSSLKPGTLYHFRVHSTDASNYSVASSDLTLTTAADTTPPTVSISSPVNGVTVSGTITVTANASDNVGVASVQFLLDGANLGSLDTTSPYSVSWNTTTASNASHALSAIAKDAAGNSTTSAGVTVTVSNAAATPPSITTQPANQTVMAGQTARFTVVAAGTAPLGYQWQKNGASIAGATAASYTTPATTTADSGATFRVVVTNTAGTVTSSSATLTVNPAPAPAIQVNPTSINFGNGVVGISLSQVLIIKNTGTATLTITQVTATGSAFSVSGFSLPLNVNAGQQTTITVAFLPTVIGSASGNISIVSNAPTSPTSVGLSGTGIAAILTLGISPTSLSFGSITTGTTSAPQTVTITNTGNSNVTISQINLIGAGYTMTGGGAPVTLSPSQTITLVVQFSPTTAGAVSGSITIVSNATGSPATVSLSGTGVTPVQHSVTLTWNASTSTVSGYNVYRSTVSGSGYTKLNSSLVAVLTYSDSTVQSATTYFYVTTAVDSSGNESVHSNEVSAVIP